MIPPRAACALLLACSAPVHSADLLDVYRQARSGDSTYAAARATWAAAQERIPQGRSGLLPLASVTASTRYSDRDTRFSDTTLPRSQSDSGSADISLSVTQPIYRRQNSIVYQQAFTQAQQADAQLALAAQDLILRVAEAYFAVLLAQDSVSFAGAQRTAIGEQLEQAKRNFEVGTATVTDTNEAQARYDLTTAQEIGARNELALRRHALEQLLGRDAPALAPLGSRFTLKSPVPSRMNDWVTDARQQNLQVRISEAALKFSEQEIARNRAAHLPTLDAFATVSGSSAETGTTTTFRSDTRSNVVGLQLTIPIYSGGAINSRVREAVAQESRAREELEAARRNAEFNARQAYLGITSGMSQVNALQAAVVSTQSQLDSTRLGRDVGVRKQVDVLNSQQLLFSASRDLAQAKYTYVLSLLRLEAAVGELTEDDLVALNAWLDPRAATETASASGRETAQPATTGVSASPAPAAQPLTGEPIKPVSSVPADSTVLVREVEGWARAWSANDVKGYLSHYAGNFEPARGSRAAWEAERRARIQAPRRIAVAIQTPQVTFEGENKVRVEFRQHYVSGSLNVLTDKTLVFARDGERWLIVEERIRSERAVPQEDRVAPPVESPKLPASVPASAPASGPATPPPPTSDGTEPAQTAPLADRSSGLRLTLALAR